MMMFAAMLSLLACQDGPPTTERTATLLYMNNVDGEIEPCG